MSVSAMSGRIHLTTVYVGGKLARVFEFGRPCCGKSFSERIAVVLVERKDLARVPKYIDEVVRVRFNPPGARVLIEIVDRLEPHRIVLNDNVAITGWETTATREAPLHGHLSLSMYMPRGVPDEVDVPVMPPLDGPYPDYVIGKRYRLVLEEVIE